MSKAADGVLVVCGLRGRLHELTTAFGLQKSIAVLEGTGGTADNIRQRTTGPFR